MPTQRVSMHKIKEVIRLKAACLPLRTIASASKLSLGAVAKYVKAAEQAGLSWPLPAELTDDALHRLLSGIDQPTTASGRYVAPDYATIHQELKRKGVTLQLLWHEYRAEQGASGYAYSQFCTLYRQFKRSLKRSMRQTHQAGEKLFVDYAGQTVAITDPASGEIRTAQIFVAVLGASNYTFAEATWSQQLPDWLGSHVRALTFFGGAPAIVVPDNLKSGVDRACRYDPDINRSYAELAAHYGMAVIPARPRKPQDKAKVEVGVQIVERWILAALRRQTFFSLHDLNAAIRPLLAQLNAKPFKKLSGNRLSAFESLDKPALRPLPTASYEFAQWKKARVNIDYHIEFEGHYYSVPHTLVGKEIECRITASTVECLYQQQRVAVHVRSAKRGAHSTIDEHMPKSHRAHMRWTPGKLLNWALSIGPATRDVVEYQLTHKPHPEMGYRTCLGLLALARQYGHERLEAACQRALAIHSPYRKSVLSILQAGLDQTPLPPNQTTPAKEPVTPCHDNVRGAEYYH
ncbi:MAG: IS21 family transposase [Methylomonas sp.]